MRRISESENGGLLTFGVLAALWSSSAAMVAVTSALNAAYDIEEGRPWWKVRLIAIGLTVALAVFFLLSFSLVLAGPEIAEYLGRTLRMGPVVEWSWKILQWPIVFALVSQASALVYYFAPDAEQDWVWITPGAVVATILWLDRLARLPRVRDAVLRLQRRVWRDRRRAWCCCSGSTCRAWPSWSAPR